MSVARKIDGGAGMLNDLLAHVLCVFVLKEIETAL
ncbi:hypothetical protein XSR1_10080 [Xenorhabdus szentirmaii DSM 16338]|uniref:Uncharacterized protein n=1 Tax=Xenorhabdus szentirmaii DSM 16338 TaxID=1427518 RepID=W1ITQ0_9GAMM|nr:hypothetical protein XSR1_10080 [Xenorhabdus szentirmaii DSM 16338]